MNVVDIIIMLTILMGGVIGFKQGAIKTLTSFIGLFAVVILSFILKNYVSFFFYEYLPFFSFGGFIKGVEVINILIYEVIAFLVIFAALMCLFRMLLVITGLIERVLKATILLSIPSKIAGIFIGALEYYVYVFLGLFILNLPVFNISILHESELSSIILSNTPVISTYTEKTVNTYTEIYNMLKDKDNKESKELNQEILLVLIEEKIITKESANNLVTREKISVVDKEIFE